MGGRIGIGVLKGRDAVEVQFSRLVFREEVRDKESLFRFYVKAKFESLHNIYDAEALVGKIVLSC
jgi:hypothetical protein